MKHIATGLCLAVLVLATLTVACQRSRSEVVVYTSEDQVFSESILKDFEKISGIRVRALYDTEETKSTGVALRIVAERDHPQADVFWANEPLRPVMLQQQGLLEAYRSPNGELRGGDHCPGLATVGVDARRTAIRVTAALRDQQDRSHADMSTPQEGRTS